VSSSSSDSFFKDFVINFEKWFTVVNLSNIFFLSEGVMETSLSLLSVGQTFYRDSNSRVKFSVEFLLTSLSGCGRRSHFDPGIQYSVLLLHAFGCVPLFIPRHYFFRPS
jgi:hypothetical protein